MQIDFSSDCTFYVTSESQSDVTNWGLQTALKKGPKFGLRFVRGSKSRTTEALFDEFSAALQFPYYFGENWNAFNDCVSDLEWLNCEFCVVVIFDADQLLVDEDVEEFKTLMRILQGARPRRTEGLKSVGGVQKDLPFYAVLQTKSSDQLQNRLKDANIKYK